MATDVKELLKRLEDGVSAVQSSDEWRRLLRAQAKFHRHSLGNVCLILSQRPDATRVAGFHAWLTLGRRVRRGEHGIAILAPVFARKTEQAQSQDLGQEADQCTGKGTPVHFRVAYVFDVLSRDLIAGDMRHLSGCRTSVRDQL